jgi:hypothetical protein
MVMAMKCRLATFPPLSFRHVRRFLNEVAHIPARICDVCSLGFIYDFAPDCIRKTLYINSTWSIKCCVLL